jgi:SAM-dependent methyltransferase
VEDKAEIRDHAIELLEDNEALEVENTLWWLVGRRSMLSKFLQQAQKTAPIRQIVEIGCGSGGDLSLLSQFGAVSGVERSPILAKRARARNIAEEIWEKDFFEIDWSKHFDLVCLFDVLEHVEDDSAFLRRLSTHAHSGDFLLLSVPACQLLYSEHDALLHHYRRYSRSDMEKLLYTNGYETIRIGYFVCFLFPFVVISRLQEKLLSMFNRKPTRVRLGRVPTWLNTVLAGVMKMEDSISGLVRYPFGAWIIALARKC